MAMLRNTTRNLVLAPRLEKAQGILARFKGLLGRQSLPREQALWIPHCNSIHTFFMQFPIDAVFVDRNLKVKKINRAIEPGRILLPVLGAQSVFEFAKGAITDSNLQVGDKLDVGD